MARRTVWHVRNVHGAGDKTLCGLKWVDQQRPTTTRNCQICARRATFTVTLGTVTVVDLETGDTSVFEQSDVLPDLAVKAVEAMETAVKKAGGATE